MALFSSWMLNCTNVITLQSPLVLPRVAESAALYVNAFQVAPPLRLSFYYLCFSSSKSLKMRDKWRKKRTRRLKRKRRKMRARSK
ncbi:hypothetical protein ACN38_g2579 [Penicillium nordicum]|uniref:60S ribosomal protein L41 n=1 Tax=Penicillium nordicum TaxID=229535 RepID=A0A0M8P763_9EURO|nr:hypothetical protein ACN38_g2579 [Penicillium nordicum]